jgi:hypothetical protein
MRAVKVRAVMLAAAVLAPLAGSHAAELDGVAMPDTRVVDGTQMWLNGIGLRTFSLLGIRVYVAGLYLQRRSGDAETILHSPQWKLLHIRFLRDVDAEDARKAWRDGFEQNCHSPCTLEPDGVRKFLAAVPSVHKGDESSLLFTSKGVDVTLNGRTIGDIPDLHFAEVMLSTFIGPQPPTPQLKRELLGFRD